MARNEEQHAINHFI